jgi:PAS domain S-box-containing protein
MPVLRKSKIASKFDRWLLGGASLIALLAIGVFLTLQNVTQLSEDAESATQTQEVMDILNEVHAHLREAEASQRSYVITGGESMLNDFASNIDVAKNKVEQLSTASTGNASLEQRLTEIDTQIAELTERWESTIAIRKQEGFDAAKQIVATDEGRRLMSALEQRLNELDKSEDSILKDRLAQREASYRWAVAVGLLSGIAAILGIVAFTMLLRRHLSERTTASTIIAEQGERLRTTLASIGDAVITTDTEGRITGMNAVAESLTGWQLDEARNQSLDDVFHIINEESRETVESPATKALAEGALVGLANHTLLVAKDGTERPIDDSAAPIRCSAGEVVGCVLVFRDISERRTFEREISRRLVEARLLAAIVESSNDAIVSKSLDGVVQSWNAAAEQLFGYSAAEAVGQHISLVIPAERLAEEDEIIARMRAGERIEQYETERLKRDGKLVPVSLTISPLRDENGEVVGASKIARDISARREAEAALRESEERFRTLADNMSQFAWMADEKGWIFWYNQRWFDYTGTTLEEMQGWGWKKVHHPDHVDRVVAKVQHSWDTGEIWEDTFPLRDTDGQYRWFLSRAAPIRDEQGNVLRWFGTNTDITEVRQLQENLRRLAADLSEADRRKDEFLATLAHELRNPLAAIFGASELLHLLPPDEASRQETVEIVHDQAQHMVRLIDDLMDVSRITRGKFNLRRERVDLAEIVEHAVDSSQPLIDQSQQRLTVNLPEEPISLNADPIRLGQVFSNLLNNAAKYSEPGGQITLTAARANGHVAVSVQDTGIGIDPAHLSQLFEMFSQFHSETEHSQGGLGIGLALVRGLVEMHGGTIEARSEGTNKGSEFIVRLPLVDAECSAEEDSVPHQASLATGHCRVLVADDNRGLVQTLALLLQAKGHDVHVTFDGAEAVAAFESYQPHLVLLDIGMPKLNGYETARQIRRHPQGKRIILVAMTGWGQDEDKRQAYEAGFDHHLTKPVATADLDEILARVCTDAVR